MKILFLEDTKNARFAISNYNNEEFEISFAGDLISFHGALCEEEGYNEYGCIVLDLQIEMFMFSEEVIASCIEEFKDKKIPSLVPGQNMPLYGLDYYKEVIYTRPETKKMVDEGRVILITGHEYLLRRLGLYNENLPLFEKTKLIARGGPGENERLFGYFRGVKNNWPKAGGTSDVRENK